MNVEQSAAIDVCMHGRPDHQVLIRELREACGLSGPPLPITPLEAWNEAIAEVERMREQIRQEFGE